MNNRIIIIICVYLFLFISNISGAPVASISHGTRNTALGHTGVSYYANVTSIFYNPSLLLLNYRNTFDFEYSYNQDKLFNMLSFNYMRYVMRNTVVGLNFIFYQPSDEIIYDGEGNILEKIGQRTHVFNSGICIRAEKRINIGTALRFVNNNYNEEAYNSIMLDFGLVYLPYNLVKNLNIGINFMNLLKIQQEFVDDKVKEPFNLKAGVSYSYRSRRHDYLFAVEFNSKKDYFSQYGVGAEFILNHFWSFRIGYNEKNEVTAGSGVKISSFQFDYSCEKQQENDVFNHKFSITYYFPLELDEAMKEKYYNKGLQYYNDFHFKRSYEYFKKLYKSDRFYRETEYYYELLQKRTQEIDKHRVKRIALAEVLYQGAVKYYKQKENNRAINKLIECLKKNKNHQDAKILLSRIKTEEIESMNKKQAMVRVKEGDYYFLLSNFPAALFEYKEALKLSPKNKEIQNKIKQTEEKLSHLDIKALGIKLSKEGENLFNKKEYNNAIALWREALAINPDLSKVRDRINKAEELMNDMEDKKLTDRVVNDHINNLFKIIAYKIKKENYSSALFQVEEILEIKPDNKKAKMLKARILKKIDDKEIKDNQEKSRLGKKHLKEGINLYKKGEMDKALYHLAVVIAMDPKKGQVIKELNLILKRMAEFEALGVAKDSPNYKLVKKHYIKGTAYYNKHDFAAAAAEWKRVVRILPNWSKKDNKLANVEELAKKSKQKKLAHFHLKRAETFLKQDKKKLALAEAKRILAILPEHKKAERIIKKCLEGSDMEQAVRERIENAKELSEDSKYNEAIQELKIALISDPGNKIAKKRLHEYKIRLSDIEKEKKVEHDLDLAYKYFAHENYNNAKELVRKVLEIDYFNKKAKKLLNEIKEKEMHKDFSKVEKKKIIKLYNQGITYYLDQKYKKCIEKMKSVIALDIDNVQALKFIEKSKERLKDKAALPGSKKRKKIDKKLVWKYYLKGMNYYTSGDMKNAIKEWQHALQFDPENKKIKQSIVRARAKKAVLE